ncbi:MAG: AI-2E family transporter [Ilumatobacteraceae bacterium]
MPPDPDEPVPPATRPAQATVPVSDPRHRSPTARRRRRRRGARGRAMPRWVWRAVAVFWIGFLVALAAKRVFSGPREPARDPARVPVLVAGGRTGREPSVAAGWRRGSATGRISSASSRSCWCSWWRSARSSPGRSGRDLLRNSETYVTDTVDWLNDTFDTNIDPADVIAEIQDEDGRIQQFIADQGDEAVRVVERPRRVVPGPHRDAVHLLPRRRRPAAAARHLQPSAPVATAARSRRGTSRIDKTGRLPLLRSPPAGLSAVFHWIVFQAVGTQAPLALAGGWGSSASSCPSSVPIWPACSPVLVTLLDSPVKALIIAIAIVLYQQVENYVFAPRITARTMELHPALAVGSAIAGAAVLGAVGAILALPAVAMFQALMSNMGPRFEVVDDRLTQLPARRLDRRAVSAHPDGRAGALGDDDR